MMAAGAIFMVIGSAFSCIASLGIVRFPDIYTRLHAASKAGALGVGLILVGAGIASGDGWVFVRCLVGLAFVLLVSPVSAHLLARAARKAETPAASNTSIDQFGDSP